MNSADVSEEVKELFFVQKIAMEEHLRNSEFSPDHRQIIRSCIDGDAQLKRWQNAPTEEVKRNILRVLRNHYAPDSEALRVGLTVAEDVESLALFDKEEIHQMVQKLKAYHEAIFRRAIKNAGATSMPMDGWHVNYAAPPPKS